MDNYRNDGFDGSSQCFQEIIQLIALNSRHYNTFCWRRELNPTENGKVLHEKVLKMKGHSLALHPHPTPLTCTDCFGMETTLYRDSPTLRLSLVWDPRPHRVPAFPLSPTPLRNPHANYTDSERGQSFNVTLLKLKTCDPLNTAHKFTVFSSLHWGSL